MPINPKRRIVPETGPVSVVTIPDDAQTPRRVFPYRRVASYVLVGAVIVIASVAGYTYRGAVTSLVASIPPAVSSASRRVVSTRQAPQKPAAPAVVPVAAPVHQDCSQADMRLEQLSRLAVSGAIDSSSVSQDLMPQLPASLSCAQKADSLTAFLADQVVARELYIPGQHGEMIEKTPYELRQSAARRQGVVRRTPRVPASVKR